MAAIYEADRVIRNTVLLIHCAKTLAIPILATTQYKKGLGPLAQNLHLDQGGTTFQHGSQAFDRIMAEKPEVDAVLCANDIIAIGFMRAAIAQGRKIPEDIAVIGCDDVKIARFHTPALTSIQLHEYDIGQRAVSQLDRLISGETELQNEIIETELIIRESA